MNDIIKNIEAAQLKSDLPEFRVGDTVKVYNKIKEGNRERIQNCDQETERRSQRDIYRKKELQRRWR